MVLRSLVLLSVWIASSAWAQPTNVSAGGFTASVALTVKADARTAWQQLERVGEWWNAEHSWSGDASNLYLNTDPGGCFCERLPDGGWVEHLRIIYIAPGKEIRFDGALGPLVQMGLDGTMTWTLAAVEESGGTEITFTYIVHGQMPDGFNGIALAVHGVVEEQLQRLAARLGSG